MFFFQYDRKNSFQKEVDHSYMHQTVILLNVHNSWHPARSVYLLNQPLSQPAQFVYFKSCHLTKPNPCLSTSTCPHSNLPLPITSPSSRFCPNPLNSSTWSHFGFFKCRSSPLPFGAYLYCMTCRYGSTVTTSCDLLLYHHNSISAAQNPQLQCDFYI